MGKHLDLSDTELCHSSRPSVYIVLIVYIISFIGFLLNDCAVVTGGNEQSKPPKHPTTFHLSKPVAGAIPEAGSCRG